MEELESRVQKNLVSFCKILPVHVEKWRNTLTTAQRPAQGLSNFADQLRHAEKTDIKYLEGFQALKEKLLYRIYTEMEEEIGTLKRHIDLLNQSNHDLKNKLTLLEKSTADLNWEADSPLIRGSALQPSLEDVLQGGLEFWTFFSTALKRINEKFRNLNVRDEKFMTEFENSFKVDLESRKVRNLLALVQYIDNPGGLI